MKIALRYPLVMGTVAALLAVVLLLASGQEGIARIAASIYALAVAAYLAVGMVRRLLGGQWGIDILAVTAIVSTVLVGEFIASMIIVLMMAGGTALEDYAAGRAKKELTSLLERVPQTAHRERNGNSANGGSGTATNAAGTTESAAEGTATEAAPTRAASTRMLPPPTSGSVTSCWSGRARWCRWTASCFPSPAPSTSPRSPGRACRWSGRPARA